MAIAPEQIGIGIRRHFTTPEVHPHDTVEWERREARIQNYKDGTDAFFQPDVEFPTTWSQNSTNIVAQKYFRGTLGTAERETSLRQVIDRIADTITAWGTRDGYFVDERESEAFLSELKFLLLTQRAAFNSPVWFNIGVKDVPQQSSACFILAVEDTMDGILNWYREEGTIFKGGSGSGINLSNIRSSEELLKGGGTASGPVSFMRGADASAGTIKSGGKTRRAAKMVILNVDHPDIEEFIWCKAIEERKARALAEAGFDMDLDGRDSHSIQYQNANNSVRVTDSFMQAVLDDTDWDLIGVTTGEPLRRVRARELMRQIMESTWQCADPGMQFDTTINRWHTAPNTARINGSNPCFAGSERVHTDKGLIRFAELVDRARNGESFGIYTHDATSPDEPAERLEITRPDAVMITGFNEIVKLRFSNGSELRCTPGHKIFTKNRGYVPAEDLTSEDRVKTLDLPAPAVAADARISPAARLFALAGKGDKKSLEFNLPEKWTEEFAHYLGWLIGDGCISGDTVTTVYGSAEEQDHLLPRHRELAAWMNGGREHTPSVQANGTMQLRQTRRVTARYLKALGVTTTSARDKVVPEAVYTAPSDAVASFLQGLFDADGCVYDGDKSRYVGLGSVSRQLLVDVQRLLTTFGVHSSIYETRGPRDAFAYTRRDGTDAVYSGSQLFDLRISARSVLRFAEAIGFSLPSKAQKLERMVSTHRFYATDESIRLVSRDDDGVELTFNLSEPRNHSYVVNGTVVRNCSEYMHIDNSACNLASINLLRYLDDEGNFDTVAFEHTVDVMFTAQEILVGNADYPTEAIAENTRRFRQLGLGYANLGALLMAQSLPYDSEGGRAWAAAITALMTGRAYATSARTAGRMGPFAGFAENAEPMLNVLRMHRAETSKIDEELVPPALLGAAQRSWDDAVELGEQFGVRNSQSTVLAPTGTIGLMMDCDTTGVEPDLALMKAKKLVGGGTMFIVNQTIPRALRNLGYSDVQVDAIIAYIDEHKTIIGAPAFDPEHLPVFACSMGDNTIHYMGHVKMMGAVQPFISGAISKCVVGDTLVTTADGLVRIGSLHQGEMPDSFRDEVIEVASLDGTQKTDAFYYGGVREVREATLRSGHRIVGTPNHRLLVAGQGDLDWVALEDVLPGEYVAVQYGDELWSTAPARLDGFAPSPAYGPQKAVRVPDEMSVELAFLLGAYASEGHTTRSNHTISITNSVDEVLEKVAASWRTVFGVDARIVRPVDRCPAVVVSSKTIVELFEHLGCGARASAKRIPDAVLRSRREMVLAFLQGLSLDAYATVSRGNGKWAICLDSPGLLDDLQAVLTNLGVVHGRIGKLNKENGKTYDEVYVVGEYAARLVDHVPFLEPDKAARARELVRADRSRRHNTADVVPGITPRDLYELLPSGRSGASGKGTSVRAEFAYLCDDRTRHVSRRSLERVAAVDGVTLPGWLRVVLRDNLHFSPVESVGRPDPREVFDVSVPTTHAFVANGIVNHNTVNMPEDVTVDDVEQLHIDAWKLGVKAIAIYRDNCKVAQPLSTQKAAGKSAGDQAGSEEPAAEVERIVEHVIVQEPVRQKLPRTRNSKTFSFRVADCRGFATVAEYEDGRPGELFLNVSKQGSTLAGLMDSFAISVSHGLQYGVPLRAFVETFSNRKFEPAGMTDDPDIRIAQSLVDYIFRKMAVLYLPYEERVEIGVLTTGERTQPTLPGVEESMVVDEPSNTMLPPEDRAPSDALQQPTLPVAAPTASPVGPPTVGKPTSAKHEVVLCHVCGDIMQRAGSCHACPSCGATSGCS